MPMHVSSAPGLNAGLHQIMALGVQTARHMVGDSTLCLSPELEDKKKVHLSSAFLAALLQHMAGSIAQNMSAVDCIIQVHT